MKRKIAMLAIGAMLAVALVGGGVYAYFSDQESIAGNNMTAGTLDLEPNDGAIAPLSFQNLKPGSNGAQNFDLTNVGSIDGTLSVSIANVVNNGGLTTEPEADLLTPDNGELNANMRVIIWIDANDNAIEDVGETELFDGMLSGAPAVSPMNCGALNSLAVTHIGFYWEIDSAVGNVIQGDIVTFDVVFTLNQA